VADRVALVTGAARGIGASVAGALAADGCGVALFDADPTVVDTAKDLAATGAATIGSVVDVTNIAAIELAVAGVERDLGPIDVLANVAGVLRCAPVLDAADADWAACIAVNATGVWNVGRAVGRRMRERCRGSIVTVASNAATTPRVEMGAYSASKAAAAMLTRCLGLELAANGVRCNVVCPGSTDTAMLRSMWPDADDERAADAVVAGSLAQHRLGIPLGRIAEPSDVAAAVVFLASDAARHITLQTLTVDGGATLGS
jgi:2,3-dihydro-2,3-dihydroxybenzoate dehydrogenase